MKMEYINEFCQIPSADSLNPEVSFQETLEESSDIDSLLSLADFVARDRESSLYRIIRLR